MSCRLASLLPDEPTIRWTQLSDALLRIVWVLQLLVPYEIRIEMNYIKSNNILYLQNTRTYIYIYRFLQHQFHYRNNTLRSPMES